MNTYDTYDAARAYRAAGLSPIPLAGKRPIFPWKEYQKRQSDNSELFEWFHDCEGVNIGLVTGSVSGGLVVLDWDDLAACEAWVAEHSDLADTKAVATGGGGRHLYFRIRHSDGLTTQPFFWRGQHCGDIRCEGALVVAPPSVHPETGEPYRWLTGSDVSVMVVDSWSEFNLELGRTLKGRQAAVQSTETIPEGQRNSTLTSLAGTMRARGMTDQAIRAAIGEENRARCDPPLSAEELETTIFRSLETWGVWRPRKIGARLPGSKADVAKMVDLASPDTEVRRRIMGILRGREDSARGRSTDERREIAGQVLITWLRQQGYFIKSKGREELYYFYSPEKRLFGLESTYWSAWLHALTGANPAGRDFAYLQADCETLAELGEEVEVVRVAVWDENTQTLRVSRFDGTVYVLDGQQIGSEDNGLNVLFEDASWWEPYSPEFSETKGAALRWSTLEIPRFDGNPDMHALGYKAWICASFFSELVPTRPLLVLVGPRGSGKTMTLRVLLRLLFGSVAEVSGIPDRPDGFTAAAAANHIIVMDNLDQFTPWLRDKLARLSTGAVDHYRKLYTSNQEGVVRYRTWAAFTARTPDTLKRDDLADRIVLLPTRSIADRERLAERDFLTQVKMHRNAWWGDLLFALNKIVAAIRNGELSATTSLSMGDFESFGRLMAKNYGLEELWDQFVADLTGQQSAFLLEDNLIAEGLEMWMSNPGNHGREMNARELLPELTTLLFGDALPPRDWPKEASGFGKQLRGVVSSLDPEYLVVRTKRQNRWVYQFWPREEPGVG